MRTSVKVKEQAIGVSGPLLYIAQVDQLKKIPRNAKQSHKLELKLLLTLGMNTKKKLWKDHAGTFWQYLFYLFKPQLPFTLILINIQFLKKLS